MNDGKIYKLNDLQGCPHSIARLICSYETIVILRKRLLETPLDGAQFVEREEITAKTPNGSVCP